MKTLCALAIHPWLLFDDLSSRLGSEQRGEVLVGRRERVATGMAMVAWTQDQGCNRNIPDGVP